MEYEGRVEWREDIEKCGITLNFPIGERHTGRKYGSCRNLCFSSPKIGNSISSYNTGIFVTSFVNRHYRFQ